MQRILAVCFLLLLLSCEEGIRTQEHGTRLTSKDYPNKDERIKVLKQQFQLSSEIKDVEFDLFNVNGFSGSRTLLPGTSSADYQYVVKVDTADIIKWLTNKFRLTTKDSALPSWAPNLISVRKENWIVESIPEGYIQRGDVSIIVYRTEGVLFIRYKN